MRHGDNDDGQCHCREADQGVVVPLAEDRWDSDGSVTGEGHNATCGRPVHECTLRV